MLAIRSDLETAYESLCSQGQQFSEPHDTVQLEGLTFEHPRKGIVPIRIDAGVLAMQGTIYADPTLQAALHGRHIAVQSLEDASNFLAQHLGPGNEKLVWGFSGYATGGVNPETGKPFTYESEAIGLRLLYDHLLAKGEAPSLAIDGGVSEGFLALNSITAQSAGVPTLGFIPRQGLASIGVRDHLVVAGNTYRDRETFVGTADILVCAGGADGTERECIHAIQRGAAVLLLNLADYPPNSFARTFRANEDLRQANDEGRLVVCDSYEAVADSVDRILQIDTKSSRPLRLGVILDSLPES